VDVEIRISGGDEIAEYAALAKVLNGDRELAGRVRTVMSPPAEGQLGGVIDLLAVALGSGGAGVVLGQALTEFVRGRRSDIKITVKRGDTIVEVDAHRVRDAGALLEPVLRAGDDES
jgi:hypothetical protein